MEFGSSLTRVRQRGGSSLNVESSNSYTCSLQLYVTPPTGSVSLAEFDSMAVERLKVLRTIERHNLSGPVKGSDEWVAKIYDEFNKAKNFVVSSERISSSKTAEVSEARRRDHLSHFILRLAYCRTEELRRWFVAQEVDLLRVRFLHSANSKHNVINFMKENNLYFTPITDKEFNDEKENLFNSSPKIGASESMDGRTFYKVLFTEALELVRNRRVFIKAGYAYVPDSELITLIASQYRTSLSRALALTSRALPQLEDDDRLMSLLHDFDLRYTGSDYSSNNKKGASVTPDMLDSLATKSFPLCMRRLHETLSSVHHLKHGGRMQYGLFLKAAGLSLEDALHFWRSHFTKNMDLDKFDKQYAYSIRHNYGKEGKRTDYSPYSCIKIISGSVGPGDAHGCPFKVTDGPVLKQRLQAYGITSSVAAEIAELASKGHYQIACQKYWEATHKASLDTGINHPNQYLEESRKLAALGPGAKPNTPAHTPELATRRSVLRSSQASSLNSPTTNRASSQKSPDLDFDANSDFENMNFDDIDASIAQLCHS